MNVKMCDACKKVVGERYINRVSFDLASYELCEDCKIKFDEYKKDFDDKNQNLHNQYDELYETFRKNLSKIGFEQI